MIAYAGFALHRLDDRHALFAGTPARDGIVFLLPYATNRACKLGVPRRARWRGRRSR